MAGVVAGVVALALSQASDLDQVERPGRPDGRPAPRFRLDALAGEGTVSLDSARGRPVVLNFFASWCVPCREELPALAASAARLEDRVAFLGVTYLEPDPGPAAAFAAELGVGYPTAHDPSDGVAGAYDVRGLPATFFISGEGRILERFDGQLSAAQLERTLARLFGTPRPEPPAA